MFRDKLVYQVIPIYTKLTGLSVASRSGETIVMDGASRVYNRPDDEADFFKYAKVTATYSGNAATNGAPGVRDDVSADIAAGTCRIGALFSPNVYYDPAHNLLVGTPRAKTESSILTEDNCTNYEGKNKMQKASVTFSFRGPSYDVPSPAELSSKSTSILIGMMNYAGN